MPEKSTAKRILARVRCMLSNDWLGRAGTRFRQTTTAISDFSEEHVRLGEKLEDAPDLAWKAISGSAQEKYASALKSYSEEEKNKLESELKRRTLESNARKAKAEADKTESEARISQINERISQINEMEARITLFDKLKACNAIPVWDDRGNMTVYKVSKDFDWDSLQARLLPPGELSKLLDSDAVKQSAENP